MARLYSSPKGRVYRIDDVDVHSVTTILRALPKELKQWAADCGANHAVEHWDELAELPITKRLDRIRYAHRDVVNTASGRGTEIHAYGEKVAHGIEVEPPDELRGPIETYARFLDQYDVEPIATETPVASITHRYAGRADMWAHITTRQHGRHRALVDLKSGLNVYAEVPLQLAGYRFAELWQPDGAASEDMLPAVDAVWVAHILPDAVRLLPVDAGPAQFRQFLYVQQTAIWLDRHGYRGDEPLIGDAVQPPPVIGSVIEPPEEAR